MNRCRDGGKTAPALVEGDLALIAAADPDKALSLAQGEREGLSATEAADRLKSFGPNAVAREGRPSIIAEMWGRAMPASMKAIRS